MRSDLKPIAGPMGEMVYPRVARRLQLFKQHRPGSGLDSTLVGPQVGHRELLLLLLLLRLTASLRGAQLSAFFTLAASSASTRLTMESINFLAASLNQGTTWWRLKSIEKSLGCPGPRQRTLLNLLPDDEATLLACVLVLVALRAPSSGLILLK